MTEDIKQKAVDIYPVYPIRQLPNWSEYVDHLRSAYVDGYSLAEQEIERLKGLIEYAYITGRNNEKSKSEMMGWQQFKQTHNL